jgi:hypothetical protein
MPGLKVTLDFTLDKYSWSESHWWLTGTTPTLQNGVGPALQLASYRVPCLGVGAALIRIRISQFPASRLVLDLLAPYIPSVPVWPPDPSANGLTYSASRAFTALLAEIQSLTGQSRNYYLAGIPGSLAHAQPGGVGDQTGITWAACPDFSPRAAALNNYLVSGVWGWLTRTATPYAQAQGLATNAAFPGLIGVQTVGQIAGFGQGLQGGNAQVGTVVLLKNWRRINVKLPRLSGTWTVAGVLAPVAPSTIWTYFLLNSSAVPVGNYKGNGQIGVYSPQFATYASLTWDEVTQRKRGATINRPRGRSRSRI